MTTMPSLRSVLADSLMLSAALLSVSCTQPQARTHQPDRAPDLAKACRNLHMAQPSLWGDGWSAIYQAGATAEPLLIAEFERAPAAPGAQASLAMLGRIGGSETITLCRALVRERAPLAVEAALALGELNGGAQDEVLQQCVADRHCDVSLRTAAACSLARQGDREHAPAFLAAIVRAGTPAGRADQKVFGLPDKSRWARERYFVQRLLQALDHQDLSKALDSDAPWPTLEKLAPRIEARLRGNGTRARQDDAGCR